MGGRHQGEWKFGGRRCLDQGVGGGLDHLEQQVSRANLFYFTLLVQRLMERLELKHCVTQARVLLTIAMGAQAASSQGA